MTAIQPKLNRTVPAMSDAAADTAKMLKSLIA
jgi:hypothetical protein